MYPEVDPETLGPEMWSLRRCAEEYQVHYVTLQRRLHDSNRGFVSAVRLSRADSDSSIWRVDHREVAEAYGKRSKADVAEAEAQATELREAVEALEGQLADLESQLQGAVARAEAAEKRAVDLVAAADARAQAAVEGEQRTREFLTTLQGISNRHQAEALDWRRRSEAMEVLLEEAMEVIPDTARVKRRWRKELQAGVERVKANRAAARAIGPGPVGLESESPTGQGV